MAEQPSEKSVQNIETGRRPNLPSLGFDILRVRFGFFGDN